MAVKFKRPVGRPSNVQNMVSDALEGIALDFIEWQKSNRRVATGDSQEWIVKLTRRGKQGQKNGIGATIQGNLLGVDYIDYALFGRGARKNPEYQLILNWMRIRGIRGRDIAGRFKDDRAAAVHIAAQIGRIGTKAIKLTQSLQDGIYKRNSDQAIETYAPKVAEQSVNELAERFSSSLRKVKNVQVNITS